MKVYVTENPQSALAKVYKMGITAKSSYLIYYQKLESTYVDPKACEESIEKAAMKHARFASFKLVVKKSQLSIVENPDIWPAGILIGRWWEPKAASTPELDALGTGNG